MSEMCSVCMVRAQRDDEFLPCSAACFRAVFNNLDQLLKEYWLDAAREAVIAITFTRTRGDATQWIIRDAAIAAIDALKKVEK